MNVSDELLCAYRAAQQVVRGIEQLPPFGLEPDTPLPAESVGLGKPGTDQLVERAADRHCRVVQLHRYEGRGCRGLVEPQEAMEQYRLSRRREAGCAACLWRAEAFAQIHREVGDVELFAGHNERNPLSDEARAVVRA